MPETFVADAFGEQLHSPAIKERARGMSKKGFRAVQQLTPKEKVDTDTHSTLLKRKGVAVDETPAVSGEFKRVSEQEQDPLAADRAGDGRSELNVVGTPGNGLAFEKMNHRFAAARNVLVDFLQQKINHAKLSPLNTPDQRRVFVDQVNPLLRDGNLALYVGEAYAQHLSISRGAIRIDLKRQRPKSFNKSEVRVGLAPEEARGRPSAVDEPHFET